MKFSSVISAIAVALTTANAQQLADDPASYFGGVKNGAYLDWLKVT